MYKTLLASAIGLALSTNAMASSYQFEGLANYISTNDTYGDEGSSDGLTAAGTYYFSPVTTDNHPLRESAFLAKSSAVSLISNYTKSTEQYVYRSHDYRHESENTEEYSSIGIAAETYIFKGLIYLGGLASHQKTKYTYTDETFSSIYPTLNDKSTTTDKDSDDQWQLNLGIAPIDNLLVWSEFTKSVHVNHSWNLNAKYVMEFNGSALNVQGGLGENAFSLLQTTSIFPENLKLNFGSSDDLDINSAYILGDYYFDNTLSVGVGATYVDAKDFDVDNSYMIRAQKFFSESFSVRAQYTDNQFDRTSSIGAAVRF